MAGAAGGVGIGATMNDLLGDTADGRVSDLESGASSSSASANRAAPGQNLMQFFQETYDVNSSITEIQEKLLMLQNTNEEYRNVTRATGSMKVIKEKMDEDLDEICVLAGELRGKVEALDRSNAANREIRNCQAGSCTDRTRMSMTSDVKRRLRELTIDFQVLGQRFQDGFWEIAETRLFSATGQLVDESMITRLIETGDSEPIFPNDILAQGRREVLDTVFEIQERYYAVKDIEMKFLELHQIFPDIGIVVEVQGEVPDNIEPEVDPPVDNAFDHYGKCLCVSILVVLIFAAVILVLTLVQKKVTK